MGGSVITVASSAGMTVGAALLIGDEDFVRIKAVHGNSVTITRWRWWHTAASRLRRWQRKTAEAIVIRWCALRGHRLDGEYCNCGEREDPDWLNEWESS